MIRNIAVIGAGTMGHSIAGSFAQYGYSVSVYEKDEEIRIKCFEKIKSQLKFLKDENAEPSLNIEEVLEHIKIFSNLEEAVKEADYVIEAIPEVLSLKQDILKELLLISPQNCLIASNTSSIPFSTLTEKIDPHEKRRIMISHWYNPAFLIPLVELSFFGNMPLSSYLEVEEMYKKIGKRPAKVLKDIPGLLANRIQQAIAREVFSLIEMEAADAIDIETALKFGPAFRYATTGQLEVADFGGLDIWCTVGDNLLPEIDNSEKSNIILRAKTAKGDLGVKTGKGFFEYPQSTIDQKIYSFNKRLLQQLKISKNY